MAPSDIDISWCPIKPKFTTITILCNRLLKRRFPIWINVGMFFNSKQSFHLHTKLMMDMTVSCFCLTYTGFVKKKDIELVLSLKFNPT